MWTRGTSTEAGEGPRLSPAATIGALDPAAWAGFVVSDAPNNGFAVQFAVERDGERASAADLFYLVHEVGPHAPDGSYARVAFDVSQPLGRGKNTPPFEIARSQPTLIVEWGRTGGSSILARVTARYHGMLEARAYFPWDWRGTWSPEGERLSGRTERGEPFSVSARMRPAERERARWRLDPPAAAVLRVPVEAGDVVEFHGALGADWPQNDAARPDADTSLGEADARYRQTRVTVEGAWAGLADAVTNNIHWMVALQPETGRRYTPAGRRWIFPAPGGGRDHWTIFCWDSFFNALELAVESPELARETLEAVLATQYDTGNIPNWRGRFGGTADRSQPPVGSFAVLKYFLRTGDREFLERAFPALERWAAWWRAPKDGRPRRDGNANGLYGWGSDLGSLSRSPPHWERDASDHQKAAWESGQDDLPNWDDARWNAATETLELDAVDLNALLALDAECLATMADGLGHGDRAAAHRARHRALVARMNELLWDDERGMYVDRHWDGRRSSRLAASNFYPLLAGVPDRARARRMVDVLLDERRFWGPFVVPTISRDDPAFPTQQYWRGSIWPTTNYLIYQGLRRYGFDDVAASLARRSVDLFLRDWQRFQRCRENFDSRTGEGAGQLHQSWGPLFALVGIEEFLDVTPWEGLRIGSAWPPAAALRNLVAAGHRWSLTFGPTGMRVERDDALLLETSGPVVLRNVTAAAQQMSCDVACVTGTSLHAPHIRHWIVERAGQTRRTSGDRTVVEPGRSRLTASTVEA